jgi:hypothetical protein
MTNATSTKETSGACTHVSYVEFMGSRLAELVVENGATSIFDELLGKLRSTGATRELAGALRDYANCASAPIRVRLRTKEFETTCLGVVENSQFDVLDDAQLERYVLPLILRPDFRVLEEPMKKLRQSADKLGLPWENVAIIVTRIADRLSQLELKSQGPEQQVARMSDVATPMKRPVTLYGERDPSVAARRAELRNILRSNPKSTARLICTRWDFLDIKVPERWSLEGNLKWIAALQTSPNKVQKLISSDKKQVLNRPA